MKTYRTEVAIPVLEFGWEPTEAIVKSLAQEELAEAGFPNLTIGLIKFQEYDSPNPHHACGYWAYDVTGHDADVDGFIRFMEQ